MAGVAEVAKLFKNIDSQIKLAARVDEIIHWIELLPGVDSARLICVDRLALGPANDTIYRLPSRQAAMLPHEAAVLNGKSPIPSHIFPVDNTNPITVFSPFEDKSGDVIGALLIKSDSPKAFLKRHDSILQVVTSKARDVVELAALHSGHGSSNGSQAGTELTPRVIGKLMDLLNLPMYVLSTAGQFVAVNNVFLEQFQFADLEEVNQRGEIFIREEDWSDEIRRLTNDGGLGAHTVNVRTGDDHVRTVQDYSTLVGRTVFGVLLDVTDFVRVNEQLGEALDAQTLLNDKLTSTTSMLQKTQATAMKTLAKLAEYRDKETGGHLQRICEYMKLISIELHRDQPYTFHVSEDYVDDIYISGMLHDIGKVAVPDQILLKPGPLTSGEWDVMKKHTNWGYAILSQADQELGEQSFLTLASRIALHHHEWFDGSGYPRGLHGQSIPLSARIGAVADVYDALTSRRPYKEAWNHQKAVAEVSQLSGSQFDPVISDIFVRLEDNFRAVRAQFSDDSVLVN